MLTTTLCAALSAAGLAVALLTAYRRRFLAATRLAALALLPVGLALAGLVTLGRRVGTAFGSWAADLVFKPSVWTGFGVLACSAALYGVTRLVAGRRTAGGGGRTRAAAEPGGSGPALPGKRGAGADSGLPDFAEVEEILRRRGI